MEGHRRTFLHGTQHQSFNEWVKDLVLFLRIHPWPIKLTALAAHRTEHEQSTRPAHRLIIVGVGQEYHETTLDPASLLLHASLPDFGAAADFGAPADFGRLNPDARRSTLRHSYTHLDLQNTDMVWCDI